MFSRASVLPLLAGLLLHGPAPATALWPAPKHSTTGSTTLDLNQNIAITYNGATLSYTAKYEPQSLDDAHIVQGGVSRALDAIFSGRFVPWRVMPKDSLSALEPATNQTCTIVSTLELTQTQHNGGIFKPADAVTDESYNLTITNAGAATLSAVSSAGLLRGLETFTQLFYMHSTGTRWYTPYAPVDIQDAPQYSHRGLMLDTARNFFPVSDILRTIDAMAMNKMNRIHIHATDSQSWPLDITTMPEVAAKGAYCADCIYTASDVEKIQAYGIARGVETIFEIDMPGHIGSLQWSHPELVVAYDAQPYYWWCAEPPCGALSLNNSAVDDFLGHMFDDLLPRLAPYSAYFHTGGDELNANDSMIDPTLRTNASEVLQPLLQKFIDTQHARVRSAGMTPITFEEIPLAWNVTLGNDTIVNTWLGAASVAAVTAKGLRVVDLDYNYWYLDCGRGQWLTFDTGAVFQQFFPFSDWCAPTKNWQLVYSHDPRAGLDASAAALVLGGELGVWTETIDPANLDQIVWPRAAAAAEALWSGRIDPATGQNRSAVAAAPRLAEMRERMNTRGMAASPVQMTWCTQADNATACAYHL